MAYTIQDELEALIAIYQDDIAVCREEGAFTKIAFRVPLEDSVLLSMEAEISISVDYPELERPTVRFLTDAGNIGSPNLRQMEIQLLQQIESIPLGEPMLFTIIESVRQYVPVSTSDASCTVQHPEDLPPSSSPANPTPSCTSTPPVHPIPSLLSLPDDLLFVVFSFLDPESLLRLAHLSRRCRRLSCDPTIWARLFHRSWPAEMPLPSLPLPPTTTAFPPPPLGRSRPQVSAQAQEATNRTCGSPRRGRCDVRVGRDQGQDLQVLAEGKRWRAAFWQRLWRDRYWLHCPRGCFNWACSSQKTWLAWVPGTSQLVSCGEHGVFLHEAPSTISSKLTAQLLHPPAAFTTLHVSPAAPTVAVGAQDGTVRLVPLNARDTDRTLRGHRQSVTTLSFTSDGSSLASGCSEGTVRVWALSARGPAQATVLRGHGAAIVSLYWRERDDDHSDSARSYCAGGVGAATAVVSASKDGRVKLWDVEAGTCVSTLRLGGGASRVRLGGDATNLVPCASAGPSGLSGSGDEEVDVLPSVAGRGWVASGQAVQAVGAVPVGHDLCATAGSDGAVKLWDWRSCRLACHWAIENVNQTPATVIHATPDPNLIAVGFQAGVGGACVRVFDIRRDHEAVLTLAGYAASITALASDQHKLVAGCAGGSVKVWKLRQGTLFFSSSFVSPRETDSESESHSPPNPRWLRGYQPTPRAEPVSESDSDSEPVGGRPTSESDSESEPIVLPKGPPPTYSQMISYRHESDSASDTNRWPRASVRASSGSPPLSRAGVTSVLLGRRHLIAAHDFYVVSHTFGP